MPRSDSTSCDSITWPISSSENPIRCRCHIRHVGETGPYLGDLLHGAHYSSETFVDANGNCWSCHAVSTEQTYSRDGDYHFLLWEDIMFEPTLGGYVDGGEE